MVAVAVAVPTLVLTEVVTATTADHYYHYHYYHYHRCYRSNSKRPEVNHYRYPRKMPVADVDFAADYHSMMKCRP